MKVDGTELNTDIDKQKVLLWCLKLMLDPRILVATTKKHFIYKFYKKIL